MSQIKVQPMGARILVKPLEQENKTATGLYIPETAKEKPQTGVVVAVGDDEEIKLKVNDKILFAKYSGTEIKLGNDDYLIMECSDVLAKVLD
ncbi:co-chaperonin GroES [Bellilinea caldifistulae]|jgi:chaperonin GroES|uniref:Co-chaperonin GroES n=1 Tax=Bellilinea caldifistulae TaxID=360411 RepID=A0A0P6XJM7_9CHLR|nr:molecular chaperone GroES [Bellilinea caldifistulae]GAP10811.1 co-chaperonin GroES [Bellilinea caldifistulae]